MQDDILAEAVLVVGDELITVIRYFLQIRHVRLFALPTVSGMIGSCTIFYVLFLPLVAYISIRDL